MKNILFSVMFINFSMQAHAEQFVSEYQVKQFQTVATELRDKYNVILTTEGSVEFSNYYDYAKGLLYALNGNCKLATQETVAFSDNAFLRAMSLYPAGAYREGLHDGGWLVKNRKCKCI